MPDRIADQVDRREFMLLWINLCKIARRAKKHG